MSVPFPEPKTLYGQRTDVYRNAHYITNSIMVYPCGAVLVFQNFDTNTQKYLTLPDKTVHLKLLLVSPQKNYIATLISPPGKAVIHIYDTVKYKRLRTLHLPPDATTTKMQWMDFSCDEKFVNVITGEPDWMMLSYNWERGKIETSTKANYPSHPTAPVREVVCSSIDSSVIVIFGHGIFRLMNMQETVWRQYGFHKAADLDIISCCFLTGDRIVCGTSNGLLLLIDLGELKYIFEADVVTSINARGEKEEDLPGALTSSMVFDMAKYSEDQGTKQDRGVRALTCLTNGFAFSCRPGLVHFFEKISPHRYKKRNIYEITDKDFRENQTTSISIIKHIAVNLNDTRLIATTARCQIYEVKLWGPEMDLAGKVPFKHIGHFLHTGPIGDLALCYWKPIFVTCGTIDRTIRVWNYSTESLEMTKQYQEDVHSVSLHPTGLYAAVGFSDKLRFMTVLIDDLQVTREFPIRECPKSEFNFSGSLLAAVNRNVIQIYSVITFQNVANLRGHNNVIKCLKWTEDDKKMISCGADGAIYEWDMITFKRVGEIVNKGIAYYECALASNGKIIYTVGSDNYLKEIRSSNITKAIDFRMTDMNHVVLSRSDLMMFISGKKGWVMSVKMPVSDPPEFIVVNYHSSCVSQMKLTPDDRILITCSDIGTLCLWSLSDIEGRTVVLDPDFTYFKEILISKNDLEEKMNTIKDLTQRTFELEMEHAYQMRHTETVYKEQIKDIQETYEQAIEELKGTLDILEANHNIELNNITSDVNIMKERHEAELLELEAKYNSDLIVEYEKVTNLEKLKKIVTEEYKEKLEQLQTSKEKIIEELTRINESKLYNLNKMVEEARDEIDKEIKKSTEFNRQMEDDFDREIEDLKAEYEKLIKAEREANIRLKGESGVLKKKIISSQKDIELIQMHIIDLTADEEKLKRNICDLEQEILDLKKEINERDLTIQDKEKKIYDLKRKDQEYERYKFVLNYRIKELKNQIEPRDKEIKEKKEQIAEMELELDELQKINLSLDNTLALMREKLNKVYGFVHVYRTKYNRITKVIKRVKVDIYMASGNIQEYKKLKDSVKKLYFNYVTDKEFAKSRQGDEECIAELKRQKTYLEGIVYSLEKKVEVSKQVHYGDEMIYMKMNWTLMDEIHKIRKKLKTAQTKIQDMETLICIRMAKLYSPRQAHKIVLRALKSDEEIKEECHIKMDNALSKATIMKDELTSLLQRIRILEASLNMTTPTSKRKPKELLKFDVPMVM